MANNTWLRLYTEITRDRKIRRLPVEHRWIWITILCMAKESPCPGYLLLSEDIPVTYEDIADESGTDEETVRDALQNFISLGMVIEENGVFIVKNWDKRQFSSDSSTERSRRFRQRQKQRENVNVDATLQERCTNVAETLQERPQIQIQSTDTYTDTDIRDIYNNSSSSSSSYNPPPSPSSKSSRDDDDDDEFIKIKKVYEENFGPTKPAVLDRLRELLSHFGADLLLQAINIAVQNKAVGIRYVEKMLSEWEENGIKTLRDLEQKGKIVVFRPKEVDEAAVDAAAKYIELELAEFMNEERTEEEIQDFLNSEKFRYSPEVKIKALERLGLSQYAYETATGAKGRGG